MSAHVDRAEQWSRRLTMSDGDSSRALSYLFGYLQQTEESRGTVTASEVLDYLDAKMLEMAATGPERKV